MIGLSGLYGQCPSSLRLALAHRELFFSLIPADFEFQVVTAGISKAPLGEVAPHLTSEGQCHWQWPARSPVSASERRRGWKCPPSQLRGGGAGAGTGAVAHFGGRATKHGALVIRVGAAT